MIRWVRIRKFCSETGDSDDAVRAKISQGVWREGILWKKAPDGTVRINTRNYNKWVEGQESAPPQRRVSSLTSVGKGSVTGSGSTSRRRLQTSNIAND